LFYVFLVIFGIFFGLIFLTVFIQLEGQTCKLVKDKHLSYFSEDNFSVILKRKFTECSFCLFLSFVWFISVALLHLAT